MKASLTFRSGILLFTKGKHSQSTGGFVVLAFPVMLQIFFPYIHHLGVVCCLLSKILVLCCFLLSSRDFVLFLFLALNLFTW